MWIVEAKFIECPISNRIIYCCPFKLPIFVVSVLREKQSANHVHASLHFNRFQWSITITGATTIRQMLPIYLGFCFAPIKCTNYSQGWLSL